MITIEEAKAEIVRLRTDRLPWRIRLDVRDPNHGMPLVAGFAHDTGFQIETSGNRT